MQATFEQISGVRGSEKEKKGDNSVLVCLSTQHKKRLITAERSHLNRQSVRRVLIHNHIRHSH